jgi:hypothetical protein
MTGPFERQRVSLRRGEGGRMQLMAECGHGLAIVPVDEKRTRLGPAPTQDGEGGDRVGTVKGFTFYHAATGMRLLPKGWFFTSVEAARAGLAAIGARWGDAFETADINLFLPLAGPVMDLCRKSGVVAGKWSDLSAALDGFDEEAWTAGAAERRERIKTLKDSPGNARQNREAA